MIDQADILSARVLIVDDLVANVRLLERMLGGAGYTSVESTIDPSTVCELHRNNQYDLILLDLMMPDMDGFQVMEGLKAIDMDGYLPVLVVTAQPEHKMRALSAGAMDFINKPFDLAEVLTRVRNLLEVRLLHRKLRSYNEVLEETVSERTRELTETRLEVIRRLTRATELRDDRTGMHVVRMGLLCSQLGRAAGMTSAERDLLLNAGPMHDIGKIGIPDVVLLKPGKLTPPEWEIMKTHTSIGASLLADGLCALTQVGYLIARDHHEKWDGSGYPNGVAGEDIPLVARICAVCDVFDALTSDRVYKKAWPVEDAVRHIREQSGQHFDPRLVEAFIGILPDVASTKQQYADFPR